MKIQIVTLFPEILEGFFENSIMKRAVQSGSVEYEFINFRSFATDKHQSCDDVPYGGGAGMVIKCDPLCKALDSIKAKEKRVVYASPSGKRLSQAYAEELSKEDELVFICGHYEGYDERIVRWVVRAIDNNEYKRRQAAMGLKVTHRAFGYGRRMPVARGV